MLSKRSALELILLRYGWLISFVIILAILLINFLIDTDQDIYLIVWRFLGVYCIVFLLFEIINRHFIYKVLIDIDKNEVTLYLFKKGEEILIDFEDIEKICVNFYISFILNGKHYFYNGTDDHELLKWLKSQQSFKVGWFHKLDKEGGK